MMNGTRHWFRPDGRKSTHDIGEWYRTFILRGLAATAVEDQTHSEEDSVA